MFGNEEIVQLKEQITHYGIENEKLQWRIDRLKSLRLEDDAYLNRKCDLSIEEARNEIRLELQKAAVASDLRRVAAESELKAYKEMDTKDERKQLSTMLVKAIDGLANQKVNVVK